MIVLSVIFLLLGVVFFVGVPALAKHSPVESSEPDDNPSSRREYLEREEEQRQPDWQQKFQQELDEKQVPKNVEVTPTQPLEL